MNLKFQEYPIFEPNQVLSADHLNDLNGYLEEQNRLTRNKTIGVGIVCGLQPTYDYLTNTLQISSGTAITSSGFLIQTEALRFKFFRSFKNEAEPPYSFFTRSDEHFLSILPFDFTGKYNRKGFRDVKKKQKFNLVQLNKMRFPNFLPPNLPKLPFPVPSIGSMYELIEDKTDYDAIEQANIQTINDRFIVENCVLMLYLEARDIPLKNCDVNDCNDKGMTRQFTLKPILLSPQIADRITKRELYYRKIKGEANKLARLQIAKFNASPQGINSYFGLNQRYGQLIRDVIPSISTAINNSYKLLFPILSNVYPENRQRQVFSTINQQLTQLLNLALNVRSHWGIQYLYSYVKDLIEAYNELREEAIKWISECDANDKMFPKHILLGKIKTPSGINFGNEILINLNSVADAIGGFDPEDLLDKYRQHFIPATQVQAHPHLKSKVISLHYKIFLMLSRFQGVGSRLLEQDIRITPSKTSDNFLSERAIPFYYQLESATSPLLKNWSFQKTVQRELSEVYAFDLAEKSRRALSLTLDDSNFYRVEGHIGKNYQTVIENIERRKKEHGLSMDVVAVNLGTRGNSLVHKNYAYYFQDLESMFDNAKEELFCLLDKQASFFENLELDVSAFSTLEEDKTNLGKYVKYMPFTYKANIASYLADALDEKVVTPTSSSYFSVTTIEEKYAVGDLPQVSGDNFKYKKTEISTQDRLSNYTSGSNSAAKGRNIVTKTSKIARTNNDQALGHIYHKYKKPLKEGQVTKKNIIESAYRLKFTGISPAVIDWASIWTERTISIIEHIDDVKDLITADTITDFKFEDFQKQYNELLKGILDYRDRIFNLGDSASVEELKIINYLDILLNDCTTEKFQSIINEWLRRKNKLEQDYMFSNFISKHPEMEHGGGTPKGGTLVLVYFDERSVQPFLPLLPIIPRRFPLESVLAPSKDLAVKSDKEIKVKKDDNYLKLENLLLKESVRVDMQSKITKGEISSQLDEKVADLRAINTMELTADHLEIKGLNLTLPSVNFRPNVSFSPILPDRFYNVAKGVVVADFYLPYMCCSDTPSITYAFQAPDIEIVMDQNVYCKNDDSSDHIISVNPTGGTLLSKLAGVHQNDNGSFRFTPSLLSVGDNKFSYEINGKRKDAFIKVLQIDAAFDVAAIEVDDPKKAQANQIISIAVTPNETNPDVNYQWSVERLVSGGTGNQIYFSNKSAFAFDVSFDNRTPAVKITLTASVGGGACTNVSNKIFDYDRIMKLKQSIEKQAPKVDAERALGSFLSGLKDRYSKVEEEDVIRVNTMLSDFKGWLGDDQIDDLVDGGKADVLVADVAKNLNKIKEKLSDPNVIKDPIKLDQYTSMYEEIVKTGDAISGVMDVTKLDDTKKDKLVNLNNEVRKNILDIEKNTGVVSDLSSRFTSTKLGVATLAGKRFRVPGVTNKLLLGDALKESLTKKGLKNLENLGDLDV